LTDDFVIDEFDMEKSQATEDLRKHHKYLENKT